MRIKEITSPQPKTAEATRVDALKATKDRASDALTAERERQQANKAQKALSALNKPTTPPASEMLS